MHGQNHIKIYVFFKSLCILIVVYVFLLLVSGLVRKIPPHRDSIPRPSSP